LTFGAKTDGSAGGLYSIVPPMVQPAQWIIRGSARRPSILHE